MSVARRLTRDLAKEERMGLTYLYEAQCIREFCGRKPEGRGLCRQHYERLRQKVRKGKTSWYELEQEGRCAPAKRKRKGWW